MKIRMTVRSDRTPTGVKIHADGDWEKLDTPIVKAVGQALFRKINEYADEINRKPEEAKDEKPDSHA